MVPIRYTEKKKNQIQLKHFKNKQLTAYSGFLLRSAWSPSFAITAPLTGCVAPSTGGNGYINDYPMGRFLRDAKLYEIGAGTSEIRRLIIGRSFNAMYK